MNECCFGHREQLFAAASQMLSTLVVCRRLSYDFRSNIEWQLEGACRPTSLLILIKSNLVVRMEDRHLTVCSASLSRLGTTRQFMRRLTWNRLFCTASTSDLRVPWQRTPPSLMLKCQPRSLFCAAWRTNNLELHSSGPSSAPVARRPLIGMDLIQASLCVQRWFTDSQSTSLLQISKCCYTCSQKLPVSVFLTSLQLLIQYFNHVSVLSRLFLAKSRLCPNLAVITFTNFVESAFIIWTGWTLAMALHHDDSTINIVVVIIIIYLFIIILIQNNNYHRHVRRLLQSWLL